MTLTIPGSRVQTLDNIGAIRALLYAVITAAITS